MKPPCLSDSYKGTPDIRDKEYARSFMKVIEKGALLTAVFDSCHSGSIARGYSRFDRVRALPPDPRDAADDYAGPFPEKRGALIIAAAQDIESAAEGRDENGNEHGAFTAALMKVLSSAPLDESANDIFLQTFATMRSAGASQVPVISGPADRIRAPLFRHRSGQSLGQNHAAGDHRRRGRHRATPRRIQPGLRNRHGTGAREEVRRGVAGAPESHRANTGKIHGEDTRRRCLEIQPRECSLSSIAGRHPGKGLLALWVPPADLTTEELKTHARTA